MQIKTNVHSGYCFGDWQYGVVERTEGNGFYAAVRTQQGDLRYVNYAYTEFLPNNRPLWPGEKVIYTLYPQDWPNPGKISCIQASS